VVAPGVAFEGPSLRAATTLAWRLAQTQKAVHWLEPMAAAAHRGGPPDSLRLREPARPIASAKDHSRALLFSPCLQRHSLLSVFVPRSAFSVYAAQ